MQGVSIPCLWVAYPLLFGARVKREKRMGNGQKLDKECAGFHSFHSDRVVRKGMEICIFQKKAVTLQPIWHFRMQNSRVKNNINH